MMRARRQTNRALPGRRVWPGATMMVLAGGMLFPSAAHAQQVTTKSARIIVFGAFGTPKNVVVTGRVVEDRMDEGQAERGRLANVSAAIDVLETDEVRGVKVVAALDGIPAHAITDADGLFRFRFRARKTISPGDVPLQLRLVSTHHHAMEVNTSARVVVDAPSVGVVSDFDDTLVNTYVVNKGRLAVEVLTHNAAQLTPVPGGAEAFRRAENVGASAFFYVSSSPQSFADRVRVFLANQGFPPGAVLLKNYGAEKLLEHHGYKTRRIEALMTTFPKMRFILVGDSGEADPVIYRDLRERHPEQVCAIVIRKASDRALPDALTPVSFVPDYKNTPNVVRDHVVACLNRSESKETTTLAP